CEGRKQDVVRSRPARLLRVGREQPVCHGTQPPQHTARALLETRLVAQLVNKREAGHHHHRLAHHVEPEDGTEVTRELHHVLYWCVGPYREHVTKHELARRAGNWMKRVVAGHTGYSLARFADGRGNLCMRPRFLPTAIARHVRASLKRGLG